MRRVMFNEATLPAKEREWLKKWRTKAARATQSVIDAWERGDEKIPFNEALWSELKAWFLEVVFHSKCAYCEAEMGRFSGDAEHYRPKNEVAVKDRALDKLILVTTTTPDGSTGEHPGYFWLAHELANLLPSCEFCNRRRGKMTQFPVALPGGHVLLRKLKDSELEKLSRPATPSKRWPGYYYLSPEDLDRFEQPLLLNPMRDDPEKHLRFGERGLIAAVDESPVGQASIDVYDLRDENLRKARQEEQETASNNYFMAMWVPPGASRTIAERRQAAEATLNRYRNGEEKFSRAVLDYIGLIRA